MLPYFFIVTGIFSTIDIPLNMFTKSYTSLSACQVICRAQDKVLDHLGTTFLILPHVGITHSFIFLRIALNFGIHWAYAEEHGFCIKYIRTTQRMDLLLSPDGIPPIPDFIALLIVEKRWVCNELVDKLWAKT